MQLTFKNFSFWIITIILTVFSSHAQNTSTIEEVRQQINSTGLAVREAFSNGDLEKIKRYHHPDVVKALSYNNLQIGREAVISGLKEILANFNLEFLDDGEEEKFIHQGDLVIKQNLFGLRLIPKNGDEPFVFRGRTLLVLQRYEESPTGWATIHEMIQPFVASSN